MNFLMILYKVDVHKYDAQSHGNATAFPRLLKDIATFFFSFPGQIK